MKIKYYGTAAAIGVPGIFCDCDNCKRAKKLKGRNIRTRSQASIDDKILIDFPADTYMHVINYGLPLTKINSCLVTHSHADHLYEKDLLMRDERYTYLEENKPLTMYVTSVAEKKINTINCPQSRVVTKSVTPYVPFETEGYKITPLRAVHTPSTDPVIYIIEKDGKSVFYGNDTGYLSQEIWDYFDKTKPKFNFVNLDCTLGLSYNDYCKDHMSLEECAKLRDELIAKSYADNDTLFYLTHFAHDFPIYDEMKVIAEKYNLNVAYDGLEVEI